jgi:hypothetical protein
MWNQCLVSRIGHLWGGDAEFSPSPLSKLSLTEVVVGYLRRPAAVRRQPTDATAGRHPSAHPVGGQEEGLKQRGARSLHER